MSVTSGSCPSATADQRRLEQPVLGQFTQLMKRHVHSGVPLLVAYSGGLDSTVLLHLTNAYARKLGAELCAVHVNHNLSDNSADWEAHCRDTCRHWQIPLTVKHVHILNKAQGLEAEARRLRYAAIEEVISSDCLVLTGQHRQDQLETFFLQLKRGAGPKGLSSMPECSTFGDTAKLLRPLLGVDRAQLEDYAAAHQLKWIDDESNLDTRFDRNFLRQEVLPVLYDRWTGFAQAATRSIELIAEQQSLVEEVAAADLVGLERDNGRLDINGLSQLSMVRAQSLLRYWLDRQKLLMPSKILLQRIFDEVIAAKPDASPVVSWNGYQVRRFRDQLCIVEQEQSLPGGDCLLSLNCSLRLEHGIGEVCLSDQSGSEGLVVLPPPSGESVWIRFGVFGLSFQPAGAAHHRKLKSLFKELDIAPWERLRTPILFYGDKPVAIGRYLVSDEFAADKLGDQPLLRFCWTQ